MSTNFGRVLHGGNHHTIPNTVTHHNYTQYIYKINISDGARCCTQYTSRGHLVVAGSTLLCGAPATRGLVCPHAGSCCSHVSC